MSHQVSLLSDDALCNAHHMRELKALIEIEKEDWARRMQQLLRRACHAAKAFLALQPHTSLAIITSFCGAEVGLTVTIGRSAPDLE